MKPTLLQFFGMAAIAMTSFNVGGATIFSTDFESGVPVEITGSGSRTGTEGYSAHGFGDFYFRNASTGNPASTTRLDLSGLSAHTDIEISFALAIIDSWDGNTPAGVAPDFFNVLVDGASVLSHTFDNFLLADQSFPGAPLAFGSNLAQTAIWSDSAYLISIVLPHTSSTLSVEWFASGSGWQGGTDESWAIDNIEVVVRGEGTAVPDTGSALLLFGIVTMALFGSYRRKP